ncbi:hypothetical protein IFO70_08725 [Phormidium tenue FACHB-886]|nr:hypothetical protein [Phormidium tenue FACHB-886]
MDSNISAPDVGWRSAQSTQHKAKQKTERVLERKIEISTFNQAEPADAIDSKLPLHSEAFNKVSQLEVKAQVALIHRLISQLETDQIQSILEFGQQELTERRRCATAIAESRQTRLLLKKDYSYQNQGLSEPTQYYVYLRRRNPKLDRYIGTLFYVPKGCMLSYSLNAKGQVCFNDSDNVFLLQDAQNPAVTQVVRLLGLEPPPPEYTFTKQQNDTPEIYLRLEYLNPVTYRSLAEEVYLFPDCMHEGGKLDRYRWMVSRLALPAQAVEGTCEAVSESAPADHHSLPSAPVPTSSARPHNRPSKLGSPARRVIELPPNVASTYYLTNRCDAAVVLERMRLWVTWSEKAMPQSRWEVVQDGTTYTLSNASFKRNILSFSLDRASITLNNSLPVLVRWFHDLGLAVSQSQRQYSPSQLQLAHQLFVEMSLPQDNPLTALEKLFSIEFSKTSLYK